MLLLMILLLFGGVQAYGDIVSQFTPDTDGVDTEVLYCEVSAYRFLYKMRDGWQQATRTFGTMTEDLLALRDWLAEAGITHVAMESTGVYWKPVFNILEGSFEVLLVNAKPMRRAMLPIRTNRTLKTKNRASEVRSDIFRKSAVMEETISAMPR